MESPRTSTAIGLVLNVPLLILAVCGFIRGRLWKEAEFLVILAIVAYMNVMTAASFAVARYSLPVMPLLFLAAAGGLGAAARAAESDAAVPA